MTASLPPAFQIHWSPVPSNDAGDLAPPGCRLLAIWPAPVNHDACFEAAGFTVFGDNDEDWDKAADEVLSRVIKTLSRLGAVNRISKPLREQPPWYLRLFRTGQDLPLQQQALLPMQWDSLPLFHARFGDRGAALRTGNGHFLLWVSLPDDGPDAANFVNSVAGAWPIVETGLRWAALLPADTQ
jgi:hypothetical protein